MNSSEAFHIREVLQCLVRDFGLLQREGSQCCGITVMQSQILYEMGKHDNLSLNELSAKLSMDSGLLSRQINNLVDTGYVNRIPDPKDRRYVILSLSEQGKKKRDEISEQMVEYVNGIFNRIPKDKHEQVVESLQLLADAMKGDFNSSCCST
ncbi:MAG TPA: MarR family winged helix-turn-helix transcriptional regulator [Bacillus sp. (in: firmicutes)]|nr:MarR family winged helix-turn-helix transcriptional regulator [Bacillus sp. (in: firmicutes)]